MRRFSLFILVIIIVIGCQRSDSNKQKRHDQFVIGHSETIHSEILGELRKIWVYVPKSDQSQDSQEKYPVIYLLDGSTFFHSLTGIIKELSRSGVIPEMAVIAVQNTNRGRDLTPTHMDVSIWNGDSIPDSGGGEKFMDFFEDELIPFVENKYNLSSYRTFIGHSLGGLTVINTIINRSCLFDNYIAIEPSLWWDNQYILKVLDTAFNKPEYSRKTLYVGIANTMRPGFDMYNLFSDTTKNTIHLRSLFHFVETLEKKPNNELKFGWEYYKDDDHLSVSLITEYDALRFIFPWYILSLSDKYYSESYSEEYNEELINLVTRHYDTISYYFGYEVLPTEVTVKNLGLGFLYFWQKPEYALTLFNLNIVNYPNSMDAYETMGDFYLMQHDTTKAIEIISKAIDLGGEEIAKDLIKKLDMLKSKN